MGFQSIKLFGIFELDVDSTSGGTLRIATDLPAGTMAQAGTMAVPVTTRRAVRLRQQGTLIGRMLQLNYSGTGITRLYGARVWARELPGGQWQWFPLPVVETPNDWTSLPLPIPPTSEEWTSVPLPIPPTSEEWTSVPLPIPPTSETWQAVPLPIPPTSEEWTSYPIPLAKTPDFPIWVSLPVDS